LEQFLNKSGCVTNNGPAALDRFLETLGIRVCEFEESLNLLRESMLLEPPDSMR
jgi:hypothetical protein